MSTLLSLMLALLPAWAPGADAPADPMRPPRPHAAADPGAHRSGPLLTAVRLQGTERLAVFDGTLVHAGDLVDGYRILAILDDGVRFLHDGQVQEQHLPHPTDDIKKPAAVTARAVPGDSPP